MQPRHPPRSFAVLGLALALVLGPLALPAQAPETAAVPTAPGYGDAIAFARTLVHAMMEASGTPGMSVAVGIDGKLVWSEGFGHADLEHRVPVWEDTRFRIGSVSKPLTAAALGLLYEEGRLDLDAPVQRYVPGFPEKRWPITTRLLAGHLAGVRHYRGQEFLSNRRYESVTDGLEIFKDDSLLYEPGTRYSYSSYGWNLISAVVEGAAGEDFLTQMQKQVLDPLGMRHTSADHTDSIIPQRTRFYHRLPDGRVVNAVFVDNSYKWAGGGFLSTPADLVRFGMAHLDGGLLRPPTVELLWTSQNTRDGQATGYGIGWRVENPERGRMVSHGGGSVGGRTFLLIDVEANAVLAMVGNMTQAPTGRTPAQLILDVFLDPTGHMSSAGGHEILGAWECTASLRGQEVGQGRFEIMGGPAGYWGLVAWDNGSRDRIVHSIRGPELIRLITVDQESGSLTEARFDVVEDAGGLAGSWLSGGRTGELTCGRP